MLKLWLFWEVPFSLLCCNCYGSRLVCQISFEKYLVLRNIYIETVSWLVSLKCSFVSAWLEWAEILAFCVLLVAEENIFAFHCCNKPYRAPIFFSMWIACIMLKSSIKLEEFCEMFYEFHRFYCDVLCPALFMRIAANSNLGIIWNWWNRVIWFLLCKWFSSLVFMHVQVTSLQWNSSICKTFLLPL